MPTNEERREVARNIRDADLTKDASFYEEVKGWDHVRATRFVLVSNLGSAILIDKAIFSIDDLKIRLADLIEPEPERTCRIVENERYSDMYDGPIVSCTQCEAPLPKIFTGPYNFCPNYGAKVIQE